MAVAADLHGAGRAQAVAHARQRLWPESPADIDGGDPGRCYRRTRGEHEMGIAIAIWIHSLDVDDAAAGDAAAGHVSRAARRAQPRRSRWRRGAARGGRSARAARAVPHRRRIRTRAQPRRRLPRGGASLLGRDDEGAGRPASVAVRGPEEDRVGAGARGEDLEAGWGVLVCARGQSEVRNLDTAGLVDRRSRPSRRGPALGGAYRARSRPARSAAAGCPPAPALPFPGPAPGSARLWSSPREAAKTTRRARPCPERSRKAAVRVLCAPAGS